MYYHDTYTRHLCNQFCATPASARYFSRAALDYFAHLRWSYSVYCEVYCEAYLDPSLYTIPR